MSASPKKPKRAAHAFYNTGEEESERLEKDVVANFKNLDLHENTAYKIIKTNRSVISENNRKIVFGQFFGCKHPSKTDCTVCSGSSSTNFDPFIRADQYNYHLEILKKSVFETPQEAIDSYTFFNMIWDWNRRRAVHNYFTRYYKKIDDAVVNINLGFSLHIVQKNKRVPNSIPQDPNFASQDDDSSRKRMLPYCSWVHLPKLKGTNSDCYGIHFIDTKLPTHIEVITYLSHMLNPQPDFSEKLLSTNIRRSTSDVSVNKMHGEIVRKMMPSRRSSSNIPSATKDGSGLSPPLPRFSQRSPPTTTNTRHIMLKDATRKNARNRAQEERDREHNNADPRPARANRMKKCPPMLVNQFERGFPRIILISDNPLLEQRKDLIISASKRYCNVFSVTTPAGPAPPDSDDERW